MGRELFAQFTCRLVLLLGALGLVPFLENFGRLLFRFGFSDFCIHNARQAALDRRCDRWSHLGLRRRLNAIVCVQLKHYLPKVMRQDQRES